MPPDGDGTIVHGDYRLDNLVVAAPGEPDERRPRGPGLGDGRARRPARRPRPAHRLLGRAGGERRSRGRPYRAGSRSAAGRRARRPLRGAQRRDVSTLPWYVAFGFFKIVAILEGIHYRYAHGQTVGDGFDRIGDVVPASSATASPPSPAPRADHAKPAENASPREAASPGSGACRRARRRDRRRGRRSTAPPRGAAARGRGRTRARRPSRPRPARARWRRLEHHPADVAGRREHRRPHALRAQGLHPDTAVAVGDRQPFRERERGVLGHV